MPMDGMQQGFTFLGIPALNLHYPDTKRHINNELLPNGIRAFNNMHLIACRDGITEEIRLENLSEISKSNFAIKREMETKNVIRVKRSWEKKQPGHEVGRGNERKFVGFMDFFVRRSVFNILRRLVNSII